MEKEEKILIVITKSNWGGAQRHVFDLATKLQKRGKNVAVALGGNGVLLSKLNEIGIKTHSISSMGRDIKLFKDFLSFVALYKIIKKENPTIIHSHSPKAGGLSCFLGRILKIQKIIYTTHGWPFQENRSFPQRFLIKIFSFFTVLFSHKTIVLTKAELPRWYFTKNKFEIIPIALNNIDFISKEESREKISQLIGRKLEGDIQIIGTIAELHKNKSLDTAIKAMMGVSSSIFIIIGDGEEKTSLLKLIENKNLKNQVFLVGFVDGASKYLKAFDVFLLSSIKEGLPYVILEAGLAGLPVIATKVGGIPEIIENKVDGILINPRSVEEVQKSLILLGENSVMRKEFGKKLQEKIEKNFKLETMIEKTEEVYEGI